MSDIVVLVDSILNGEQLAEVKLQPSDKCALLRVAAEKRANGHLRLFKGETPLEDDQTLTASGIADLDHVQAFVTGPPIVPSRVTTLNGGAAELKEDGSVIVSGNIKVSEALQQQLAGGVTELVCTDYAMACLNDSGIVLAWGDTGFGGMREDGSVAVGNRQPFQLPHGVKHICANGFAFAALTSSGSVITWGGPWGGSNGGDSSQFQDELASGVQSLFSTRFAFAALKDNGSVVSWGERTSSESFSSVKDQLTSGVQDIHCTWNYFTAVKDDGSEVQWGNSNGNDRFLDVMMPVVGFVSSVRHAFAR